MVALAAYDKDYKAADTYATAVLAAGRHLYRERLTYGELSAGLSLMGTGSAGLKQVADRSGDAAAAAAQTAFNRARLDEDASAVEPVWKILSGQGDASIGRYAGDYFALADDTAADPVWRVEAVRRIGRLQRNAADPRRQRPGQTIPDPAGRRPVGRPRPAPGRRQRPGHHRVPEPESAVSWGSR